MPVGRHRLVSSGPITKPFCGLEFLDTASRHNQDVLHVLHRVLELLDHPALALYVMVPVDACPATSEKPPACFSSSLPTSSTNRTCAILYSMSATLARMSIMTWSTTNRLPQ